MVIELEVLEDYVFGVNQNGDVVVESVFVEEEYLREVLDSIKGENND